jgi:UbiD family decarboxylase
MPPDLRDWMNVLREQNLIATVDEPIDIDYTSAVAFKNTGKATLFIHVNGYSMPLLVNSISTKRMLALALSCSEDDINQTYLEKVSKGIKPKIVSTGPCKEVILKGKDVDLSAFPIPFQHEYDCAPFISAPVQFAKDPETRITNMGMYRMMYRKKDETGFDMTLHNKLWHWLRKTMEKGEPLEVACVVGLHGTDLVASCYKSPEIPEVEILGSFKGEPAEMVKCETIDVEVPSWSEIVIEGELLPVGWVADEGPYGEYTGCYGSVNKNPIFHVKAITHRKDAIYQSVTIGYNPGVPNTDQANIMLPNFQMYGLLALKNAKIDVVKVRFVSNSVMLASIKKHKADDGRVAVQTLLGPVGPGGAYGAKYNLVFDDDVNIDDDWSVFWALNYRTQPAEDVIIVSNVPGSPLDPTVGHRAITSKFGVDATLPFGHDRFEFSAPKAPFMAEVEKTTNLPLARKKNYTEQDVSRLSDSIQKMIVKQPMFFFDILKEFRSENYQAILLAWSRLREKELIIRSGEEGRKFASKS